MSAPTSRDDGPAVTEHPEDTAPVIPAVAESQHFGITPEEYMLPATSEIQLLTQDGTPVPEAEQHPEPGHQYPMPATERLLRAYEKLVVGRRINDQNMALVRQGRMAVYPSSHGQEACQVAAAMCLGDNDWLFPTYRDSVAVMSRGVDPLEVMSTFRGDWHGGYDPREYKVSVQATPLTTQLLHAVGVAHAAKLRGEDTVVLAMCGDGATSEGDFHEALNFAAVFELPVLFLIQNNGYAISVPLSAQTRAPSLAHKGVGYGMASERVDGNDLAALLSVLGRGVDLCRQGKGPLLVEAMTYRMQAHTNADDDTRYRERDEVTEWVAKDPITRMQRYLTEQDALDEATSERISAHAEAMAKRLREAMDQKPQLDPQDMFRFVYTEPTTQLAEQSRLLADELSREEA